MTNTAFWCGMSSSSPIPPTDPTQPISIRMLRMCATRCCVSATILPSRCGARAMRAIRRPVEIDAALRKVLADLEPTRRYQPSSTDGAGVRSHGPYYWRAPREFYTVTDDYCFQNRNRQHERAHARIHSVGHDALEELGDDHQRRLGRATTWPKARNTAIFTRTFSPGATEKSLTWPDFVRKAQA